jgi:Uma2 family endonuclease
MEIGLEPPYLIVKPGVSEEEFYRLADEDSDWEYLDGRIVMHSPASNRHEDLFRFLLTLFSAFLDDRGGGVVRGSRFPMRLDARWSPEPDLLVVTDAHGAQLTNERLEGPADLVVEIVSESDPGLDYREKLPRYRDAGIAEIWIVDRFRQEVLSETRTETGYSAETLSSGRLSSVVVPGFWIEVSWLWQEKLPSTLDCLRQIMGIPEPGSGSHA